MGHSLLKLDRRKKVLIEKDLQRRIILSVSLPMFIILGIVLLLQMGVDQAIRAGTLDIEGRILGFPERTLSAILFFVFATAWQAIHALKVSHKIAGAMYRMRTVLQAYRAGDGDARIRLRKNDLQQELATEINATLDWVAGEAGQAVAERAAPETAPAAAARPTEAGAL